MSLANASRNLEMADATLIAMQALLSKMGMRPDIIETFDRTIVGIRQANKNIAEHECRDVELEERYAELRLINEQLGRSR